MKTTYKNISVKLKAGVCALALTSAFLVPSTPAYAANTNKPTVATSQKVNKNTLYKTAEKRKKLVSQAVDALDETRAALKALDDKDTKKAVSKLEDATGKLEILLARDPGLQLVPAAINVRTYSVLATPQNIMKIRDQVKTLLDAGRIQQARHIMMGLASETDINTTNIPLATYPAAIKLAARLIYQGKIATAKNVLQSALNTTVITQAIVPLPVVAARISLQEAERLAENTHRNDKQNLRLSELLDSANASIKMAEDLGYGQKKDFKNFYAEIAKIRNKTSSGQSGTGFFETIKKYLASMTNDSQSSQSADMI